MDTKPGAIAAAKPHAVLLRRLLCPLLPPNPAPGEQNEAITDPLCVEQLMNGKNGRPAARGLVAQQLDDLARLPQIKAVEWFIHQQDGMRCQQRQRQQEATVIPL